MIFILCFAAAPEVAKEKPKPAHEKKGKHLIKTRHSISYFVFELTKTMLKKYHSFELALTGTKKEKISSLLKKKGSLPKSSA